MDDTRFVEKVLGTTPSSESDVIEWRQRLLPVLLLGASLSGILGLAIYLFVGEGTVLLASIYGAANLLLILLTLLRKLPYKARAIGLLVIVYVVSVTALTSSGQSGSGRVFLLVIPLISSVLLGSSGGIGGLILSTLTIVLVGWLMPGEETWFYTSANFILVSTVATITLIILVQQLDQSLRARKSLLEQMAGEKAQLEQYVFDRTQVLERRLGQIYTAAEISRAISAVLDRQALLQQVVDLVQQRFELYYVGVFLVDDQQEYAVLQAGTGEAGQKMLAEGHRLKIGDTSMVGWAVAHKEARIAFDVGSETVHFRNPHLPMTLSEMALPLVSGPRVLGALTIQSGQPDAFDQDDITVLKAIADTLATALENADLFRELETRLQEIRSLQAQYLTQAWTEMPRLHGELSYTYQASQPSDAAKRQAEVTFPVSLRGQPIGQLSVQAGQEGLSEEDLAFIEAVTTEAAIALENARLLEENQRRAQQEHLLAEISARAQQYMDLDMVLKTAVQEVRQVLKAPKVRIRLSTDNSSSKTLSDAQDGKGSDQDQPG